MNRGQPSLFLQVKCACMLFALAVASVRAAPTEQPVQSSVDSANAERLAPPKAVPEGCRVLLTPVAGSNELNVAITVDGVIRATLVWPLGTVRIPIHSTGSKTAWLEGVQPMHIQALFDPQTHTGEIVGLEAVEGDIRVSNTLCFDLDLGRYCGIGIGRVEVTATNMGGRIETRQHTSQLSATDFPTDKQLLTLDQGVLKGSASGLASKRFAPFTFLLPATPMREKLGSANGTAVLSEAPLAGRPDCYTVTVTTPVNFTCPLKVKAPVKVFVTITGTTLWQGLFARPDAVQRQTDSH